MAVWEGSVENMVKKPYHNFWHNKRILITGHTGFKGGWLALWLRQLGAKVSGLALPPNTEPNLFKCANISDEIESFFCDIRNLETLTTIVQTVRPEVVFHLAAQPLVRSSYRDPITTFGTNIMGTAHVLEALRRLECLRVAVMITTDKVYRNNECPWPYREDDTLGGHDPYSASKASSEIVIASYRDAFFADQGVAIATARAGNVIGGGDWSEDRLIPDAIRAWQAGTPLQVRRPEAVRPWQHVLEPLTGYMVLAQTLWAQPKLAGAYNFGPETSEAATVHDVVKLAQAVYGQGEVIWGNSSEGPHETGCLALEIAKSRTVLGITPRWKLKESVDRTINWYRRYSAGEDAKMLCLADITAYEAA